MRLRVGIIGCGLIGRRRAEAVGEDVVAGCHDIVAGAARALAADTGAHACESLDALLALGPDVVVVATPHDQLAGAAIAALDVGAHVLVEKPAGIGTAEIEAIDAAARRAGRLVKVGFNHRFHPGIARCAELVHGGDFGELMLVRARYGHGGRPGYECEWRMDPARGGGGELVDQGMHLIDLTHWLAGPLPLYAALLRTQFWETPVEDNAALILGEPAGREAPWAMLHASWTEWKNMFSLEVYCRSAKLVVDGLVRSYGRQTLTIHVMSPELGPPETEIIDYPAEDRSWEREWVNVRAALRDGGTLIGDLADARYAWEIVEGAYAQAGWDAPA